MPCLAYMLVHDSLAAREKNWSAFIGDPEWRKVAQTPGFADADIVSNITTWLLRPSAASQISSDTFTCDCSKFSTRKGRLCPGALAGGRADVATAGQAGFASTLDLLTAADQDGLDLAGWFDEQRKGGVTVSVDWAALEKTGKAGGFTLAIPIVPPEVWGAGVTYRRSADFREEGLGIYDKIYEAPRPELFFKATASRSAGPHQPVGRRKDSAFTAAEPEVCVIVSRGGAILGYTLANDVSAWDIERDNPLYLPQSKVYDGCFSCGPTIVTPDEVADPYGIEVTMVVSRGTTEVFKGSASTEPVEAQAARSRRVAAQVERRAHRHGPLDRHRHHPAARLRPRARRRRGDQLAAARHAEQPRRLRVTA